jgi:hypothetical protein
LLQAIFLTAWRRGPRRAACSMAPWITSMSGGQACRASSLPATMITPGSSRHRRFLLRRLGMRVVGTLRQADGRLDLAEHHDPQRSGRLAESLRAGPAVPRGGDRTLTDIFWLLSTTMSTTPSSFPRWNDSSPAGGYRSWRHNFPSQVERIWPTPIVLSPESRSSPAGGYRSWRHNFPSQVERIWPTPIVLDRSPVPRRRGGYKSWSENFCCRQLDPIALGTGPGARPAWDRSMLL